MAENELFKRIQNRLQPMYERIFRDPVAEREVVVIPSLTLDPEELRKIDGFHHYEERMLCTLMLLRLPRARLIYVTSQAIDPTIIDYFLNLLPGVPLSHSRRRLTLLDCNDASNLPLSTKILQRPRLLERIRRAIHNKQNTHMTCFNCTDIETRLACELDIPVYACDPDYAYLGSKSGSREVFDEAGVRVPDGFGGLQSEGELLDALAELKSRNNGLPRAVIKLNEGFSGEGNALIHYPDGLHNRALRKWFEDHIAEQIRFEARDETWPVFLSKFNQMGGIVEAFVEGRKCHSPSVQCRIDPSGNPEAISTHEQVLGGPGGQIFLGCRFPADAIYRQEIQEMAARVTEVLKNRGVIGRFGIDFISVLSDEGWQHYALEINLRKGGTSHPFMMLQFLSDGAYDQQTGLYRTRSGEPRYYFSTDNLQNDAYRGLTPDDLIDISVYHQLHFHGAAQEGVMFHLIGALSEFGKVGVLCIGPSPERAEELYRQTIRVLDQECNQGRHPLPTTGATAGDSDTDRK